MRDDVRRGREAYGRQSWGDAHHLLVAADASGGLLAGDLELLASAAYLVGRDDDAHAAFERAHHAYLETSPARAARCAFWLGLLLLFRGETGRATGWLARAQRLVEAEPVDCVERGYMLVPTAEQQLAAGDCDLALGTATTAAGIGEGFGEADLIACARHLQGRALLVKGQIESGLALLDEAMLAATRGELSPLLTGLIYCSVIDACLEVYAFARAREWTSALGRWCAGQPQLVAFTGTCVVHRAQIMRLNGSWQDAIAEVRGLSDRSTRGLGPGPSGGALYEQGEVHRLRGELEEAEEQYRNASRMGCDPQPGLALLRLAQGRSDAALAAMRRVIGAATDRRQRSRLLPAYTEVLLALGDVTGARGASDELREIARSFPSDVLSAIGAQARAAVELAEGDAVAAGRSATDAWRVWERIEAPYLGARARELIGMASGALGDDEGRRLQLEAARETFERLGAAPDVARIDALAPGARGGLTTRELQVLRLIAAGRTNKAIARELHVSAKTIERHISNMFVKLGVPSRAAATAYAYEHKLI